MTREQAIALGESKFYERMSHKDIARFQINQEKLCMPFSVFHEAVEVTLGRPVFTHEFGVNAEGLKAEINDGALPPTMEEILNMIPEDKRVILVEV
jgi:hypothetical protein